MLAGTSIRSGVWFPHPTPLHTTSCRESLCVHGIPYRHARFQLLCWAFSLPLSVLCVMPLIGFGSGWPQGPLIQ